MKQNTPLLFIAIVFGLMGDIFWLGAIFFPKEITEFVLLFNTSIEYSDLSDDGLTVIRFLIGLLGSIIWIVAILILFLSLNYTPNSRNYIFGAIIAWFVGDSLISIITNFERNVIFNLIFLLPILIILYVDHKSNAYEDDLIV